MNGLAIVLATTIASLTSVESGWTKGETVYRGTEPVVTYRAKLDGNLLIVEASHAGKWHTYAMDNPVRSKAAGGNTDLGLELPTEIEVTGGLQTQGPWYQSNPKDLSDPDIYWYTWGFEGVSYFAVNVKRTGDPSAIVIVNAQACSDSACRMVDRLELELPVDGVNSTASTFDINTLVAVKPSPNPANADQ